MKVITKSVIVSNRGILDETATKIEIDDLGGGEFIKVTQPCILDSQGISIDAKEWPTIRAQINKMIADIKRRE